MKFFSKQELVVIIVTFFVIGFFSFLNLRVSLRRARDAQRRADINSMVDALSEFQKDYGFFPPSIDGKIEACKGKDFDVVVATLEAQKKFDVNLYVKGLGVCEWGKDGIKDLLAGKTYLQNLPSDPTITQGSDYLYFSNTKRFQFYAYLEGGISEDGYRGEIVKRHLSCGTKVCNYGKAFGDTPLDKSIEDYENELLEKSK